MMNDWAKLCSEVCGAQCCQRTVMLLTNEEHDRLFPDHPLEREIEFSGFTGIAETGGFLVLSARCPHLGEDNLCQVYEERPNSCRDFPYALTPRCPLSEQIYSTE